VNDLERLTIGLSKSPPYRSPRSTELRRHSHVKNLHFGNDDT
jgi:hypothetical protein